MKLTEILKEIKVNPPGRTILWGMDSQGRFTELVKLEGFSTAQKALDEINKLFNYKSDNYYLLDSNINNPSYAYLANDGQVAFVKDLSEFEEDYRTEADWGVNKWSKNFPFTRG